MTTILTLDLGNTALAAGVWEDGRLGEKWSQPFTVRGLDTRLRKLRDRAGIDSAILASVVPARNPALLRVCRRRLGIDCRLLTSRTPTGLKNLYSHPEQVGADRIANAVGAFHRYGGPAIVVDFGTAITFDVITEKFEYLGGVIAPGLGISTEALFKKAALLPRAEISLPRGVLGRETAEAIRSGVYWGTLGLVEKIIRELKRELGWGRETRLVATGGHAPLILSGSRTIRKIAPDLTLYGLYLIAAGR
jgi:type III pantothenate kinase